SNDRSVPAPVGGQQRFAMVTAGGLHTCALTLAGEPFCWGFNDYGQLGGGSTETIPLPTGVGQEGFVDLSAGGLHTCGVTTAGGAFCWGDNRSGALGDDTFQDRATPVAVSGGHSFGRIRAGLHH